ncbi:protein of unknown function [Pseudorhizobium banfieldiae]|uniref:Uncharacterized protein n=1 Tax=Pseudorhizobium banfieldiae TaxID=1125847 RepID=L0NDX9_9HYPH|nr:hypothetical protein [Pseudorhizobium banfieldiae]CAD6605860.1 hypothetical protein RNT25_01738 [arsenite-oxidising bacterium NT-25]CCF19084.1 protein of unknown function [Pseudorhizobium banfieldiae]
MSDNLQAKPFGRKELEPCCGCGKGVLHTGDIHFYEVEITQCIADVRSIRQQHGLETMMGNPTIAAAFAPSTNVAQRMPSVRKLLCSNCALLKDIPITQMMEG